MILLILLLLIIIADSKAFIADSKAFFVLKFVKISLANLIS